MNRKHHFIYGGIALLIVLIFSGIEIWQTNEFKASLATESSLRQQQLKQEESARIVLEDRLNLIEKALPQLEKNLQEKETQIAGLSGQLEQVKLDSQIELDKLSQKITTLKANNADFSEVIEQTIPAVVSIRTNHGSGSGFFVDSRGYILTNNHVMAEATAATIVTSDGKEHGVYFIGASSNKDLALLRIDGSNYDYLSFADSNKVSVGERVIAVGNPGGLDFTVTQGIISAVDRIDQSGNSFLQIDVPINPGNSGGPLVNANGEVIGINTKKISSFEGIGFALESNIAESFAEEVMQKDLDAQTVKS
ncbi:trypsin-like peptidase domain-containing protein [Candidatus Woesearchaeota archaeon]|nr:trypsin-like peptidase domain-containing protein [Candidatus Woesearchaeota archaeon]